MDGFSIARTRLSWRGWRARFRRSYSLPQARPMLYDALFVARWLPSPSVHFIGRIRTRRRVKSTGAPGAYIGRKPGRTAGAFSPPRTEYAPNWQLRTRARELRTSVATPPKMRSRASRSPAPDTSDFA